MRWNRLAFAKRSGLVWLLLAVGLTTAPMASAADWDQARITRLAREFDAALRVVIEDPGVAAEQPSAMQDRRHQAALATLKQVNRLAAEMSRMLQTGSGRAPTEPLFLQMEQRIREAQIFAEDSTFKPSSREKVARASAILDELRTYYEPS